MLLNVSGSLRTGKGVILKTDKDLQAFAEDPENAEEVEHWIERGLVVADESEKTTPPDEVDVADPEDREDAPDAPAAGQAPAAGTAPEAGS